MENSIQAIQLRCYSPTEIRRLSCVQVTSPAGLDVLSNPLPDGLYDERMGSLDERRSFCRTCGLGFKDCPGHFGHYEFTFPYFNPLFVNELVSLLNMTCVFCCRLVAPDALSVAFCAMRRRLHAGLVCDCLKLSDHIQFLESDQGGEAGGNADDVRELLDDADFEDGASSESSSTSNPFPSPSQNPTLHELISRMSSRFSHVCHQFTKCSHCHYPVFKWRAADLSRGAVVTLSGKVTKKMAKREIRCEPFREISSGIIQLGADLKDFATRKALEEIDMETEEAQAEKKKLKERNVRFPVHCRRAFAFLGRVCRSIDWKALKWMYGMVEEGEDEKIGEEEEEEEEEGELDDSRRRKRVDRTDDEIERFRSLFFLEILLICSNRFRTPDVRNGDASIDGLTKHLGNIVRRDLELGEVVSGMKRSTTMDDLLSSAAILEKTKQVQSLLTGLISGGVALPSAGQFSGLRSELDKKTGLIRLNMMGKRVNFSARSVILPDPCIFSSEVAIPLFFAKSLTIPVSVRYDNIDEMRALVSNGPFVYPGANFVESTSGEKIDLSRRGANRHSIASRLLKDKYLVVHRHLQDGDVVLMNRQPTLHRPSVLAHRVRVVWSTHRSLRFHYANCQSYNADFDGDEMNMHVPQDLMSRVEAATIMLAPNQYSSPTSGSPLRGLIQDYVVAAVLMTKKDSFFSKDDYMQLVFASLHFLEDIDGVPRDILTLAPAIFKPVPLWTGKQVVSTLLLNLRASGINVENTTKIPQNRWGQYLDEFEFCVRNGRIMTGVLDKNQIGSRRGGLVHAVHECCGPTTCDEFLTAISWCLKEYLQFSGFTCGLDDALLKPGDKGRRVRELDRLENETVPRAMSLFVPRCGKETFQEVIHDPRESRRMDFWAKGVLNKVTSKLLQRTLRSGMQKPFPYNNLTLMTEAGAKGTQVNVGQISCCLGQQLFEGRRVAYGKKSGKTLPCFLPFETRARSTGYVSSRFLSGIRPSEYFFHCQAGRDGLIDTAIKTSVSGYLQRSLVKSLELLSVAYDETVRDSYDTLVQFKYGGDGVDVARTGYLGDFSFLARNADCLAAKLGVRQGGAQSSDDSDDVEMQEKIRHTPPSKYEIELDTYVETNPAGLVGGASDDGVVSESSLRTLAQRHLECSHVEPGEAVGVLAAQGIGEPSTQMTLDTFHYAGVEEAHVTQGIPRLTSLLMRGSERNVVTIIPLQSPEFRSPAELLLSTRTFRDYIQSVEVTEEVERPPEEQLPPTGILFTVLTSFEADLMQRDYGYSSSAIRKFCNVYAENVAKKIARAAEGKVFRLQVDKEGQQLQETALETILRRVVDDDGDHPMSQDGNDDDDDQPAASAADVADVADAADADPGDGDIGGFDENISAGDRYTRDIRVSVSKGLVRFSVAIEFGETRIDVPSAAISVAEQVIIRKTSSVSLRVSFPKKSLFEGEEMLCLSVEGFDPVCLWRLWDYADMSKLWTNDVKAFTSVYGIEAGRQLCEDEIVGVFQSHGVSVNIRHIRLICDFMFMMGSYRPCNRHSKKLIPGVLNRATFETATSFLKSAALFSHNDEVVDVSGRLMLGRLTNQGTGAFDVMIDIGALLAEQDAAAKATSGWKDDDWTRFDGGFGGAQVDGDGSGGGFGGEWHGDDGTAEGTPEDGYGEEDGYDGGGEGYAEGEGGEDLDDEFWGEF